MQMRRKPSASRSAGRKPTLSPTRIATYLECAVKYKYIYQDKIGRYYLRARAGYSFGSTLHHVLQQFHEGGSAQSPEELVAGLEHHWIGAGYESGTQEQAHREAGEQIVHAYHAATSERRAAQVETVAIEKTLTYDMGAFRLMGRVDRIDRHPDGVLEIIDYKSGRLETRPEELESDLAMHCYGLMLSRASDAPVRVTIYALRSGHQASLDLASETLGRFEADIAALGREILARELDQVVPIRIPCCASCDFLARCSAFWQRQAREESVAEPFFEELSPDGAE